MKRWKYVFLLAATINFPTYMMTGYGAQVTESRVVENREAVEKIRSLQKAIVSFNGSFSMRSLVKDANNSTEREGRNEGKVIFKAPSFWRIEQYDPGSQVPGYTAGCNGKSFWYDDGESNSPTESTLKKTNVEKLPADQQNFLVQSTGMSPLCVFNEGLIANISSMVDGQDNTWIFKIVPDKAYLSLIPADANVDEIKWVISKETGLLKSTEFFYKGENICSVKFENIKLESALPAR